MLACLEGLYGHPGVGVEIGVDMYGVDFRILQHFHVIGVALGDIELVGKFVEFFFIPTAYGNAFGLIPGLIDRHKFSSEAKADNGNSQLVHVDTSILIRVALKGGNAQIIQTLTNYVML